MRVMLYPKTDGKRKLLVVFSPRAGLPPVTQAVDAAGSVVPALTKILVDAGLLPAQTT